jgi:hypothetical protein
MIVHARNARRSEKLGVWDRRHTRIGRAIILLVVLLMIATQGFAGGLLVTWDANTETDLAGYRIYYGVEPSVYTQMVDVGNATFHIIENLPEGETFYVVVTAYDENSNESLPSDEIAATVTAAEIYMDLLADGIQIRWSALSGATGYAVYSSSDPYFSALTPIAQIATTSYTDRVAYQTAPFARYYVVKAFSGGSAMHTFDRVGVFSKGLKRGQNLISMPLVPADNSISRVLGSQLNGAANSSQSDKVLYWNGRDYEISWLVEGTNSAYDGKWMTQAGDQESSLKIDPDHSFWVILRPTSADTVLTFAGKVSKEVNRTINLVQGPNFIGTCYPVSVSLAMSELAADGVAVGGSSSGKADKLMRWLGSRYEVAWLVGNTGTAWDGSWFNESGSSSSAIQFNPGVGYVLWTKGDNPHKVWTYPNPQPNL